MSNGLKWLRKKMAKGQPYYYFDTGEKKDSGQPILTPLPPPSEPAFAARYAAAVGVRKKRKNRTSYMTFRGLIDKYERSPEFKALSAATKRSYGLYLGVAAGLLVNRAGASVPAHDVTPKDVVALRDRFADKTGKANQILAAIGTLYSWGSMPERGYAKSNPAHGIKKFPKTPHEAWPESLVEDAMKDPQVGLAVALFYFTGQRINEVVKMRWDHISQGIMTVYAQKTKSTIYVPMSEDLSVMLGIADKCGLTILQHDGGRPWSAGGLRDKIKAWALERGHKVVPHGLRKNAVESLLLAGCTAAEVSGITDQSLKMVEHYARKIDKRRLGQSAIIKLDAARRNKAGR